MRNTPTQRRTETHPDCAAEWKVLRDFGDGDELRAICGRRGCPSSLGVLRLLDPGRSFSISLGTAIRESEAIRVEMQEITEQLSRIKTTGGVPADADKARWLDLHDRSIALTDRWLRLHREAWDRGQEEQAIHGRTAAHPTWIMMLETPPVEPGTSRMQRPRPIYCGFPDTGYRISLQGKRASNGQRIGRRPFRGSDDGRDPWFAPGQVPIPPCRIYCPVCGALNEVTVPPGFTSVEIPPGYTIVPRDE